MAAPLVVRLPSGYGRMFAIAPGDRGRDPAGVLAVNRAGMVVVLAGAEGADAALFISEENLRVLADQPGRRRGRRGAHDHFESLGMERLDRVVEPLPVERALFRLHLRPGELGDAD